MLTLHGRDGGLSVICCRFPRGTRHPWGSPYQQFTPICNLLPGSHMGTAVDGVVSCPAGNFTLGTIDGGEGACGPG